MLLLWWILVISIVYHSGSISKTTISLLFNSIRRSLAGPDQIHAGKRNGPEEISIHRSLAGPDAQDPEAAVAFAISIHRSLAGPDQSFPSWSAPTTISIHRSLAGPDI